MKVLVTGATGFIGSHTCDALLENGHQVRAYCRNHEVYRKPLSNIEYVMGDIKDKFTLSEALIGIDCVLHLVSTSVPGTSNFDPIADITTNLTTTVSLLELMKKAGIPKIIFISSGGTVYGDPDSVPVKETQPLRPMCSYAIVKISIEHYLNMYSRLYGLKRVILRASNPYGPRQGHVRVQGLIGTVLERIATNQTIEIWGDGENIRDYFYVTDLANLCVKAIESETEGTFNAGSGIGTSVNDVIHMAERISGKKANITIQPLRNFDVRSTFLDISASSTAFNWSPQISLEAGMREHWHWIADQHDLPV